MIRQNEMVNIYKIFSLEKISKNIDLHITRTLILYS